MTNALCDKTKLTLGEICHLTQAQVDPEYLAHVISGVAPLEMANLEQISFLKDASGQSIKALESTQAGACFVTESVVKSVPAHTIALKTDKPYRAFVLIAKHLYPEQPLISKRALSAIIADSARVHETAYIGDHVVIGEHAEIGPGCVIHAGCIIGPHTYLSDNVTLESRVSLFNAVVGENSYIQNGACIGQDGFGFIIDDKGLMDVPHYGRVIVGKNVRIGANTTIDRGSFQDTVIGSNTRIDNLVQIGHNVTIGANVVICAQSGIAGSCVIEEGCVLGGQVGMADHIHLPKGTRVAAKSGVMRTYGPGATLAGIPAVPSHQWRRILVKSGYTFKG